MFGRKLASLEWRGIFYNLDLHQLLVQILWASFKMHLNNSTGGKFDSPVHVFVQGKKAIITQEGHEDSS